MGNRLLEKQLGDLYSDATLPASKKDKRALNP
jgi:hypothetical protein